jgi:hypothetical protein
MNEITFIKGKGGLGRPIQGEDHISGMVFYSASLPSGFSTSDRIKQVFSVEQAEELGIAKGSVNFGVMHYHISEFFRIQNSGATGLFVGIFAVPGGAYTFAEVTTLRDFAEGKIRQVGVYMTSTAFATSQVTTLQGIATDSATAKKPISSIIYAPDISAVTDLSTLGDLKALTAPNVSVVIGQDAGNEGADLFDTVDKSISCMGALLGAVSLSKVSENIGWVAKFNVAEEELDTISFSNGTLFKNLSDSAIEAIDDKGYIFLRKIVGIDGSYFNDSYTAVASTSDYAFIENNRTIDKAIRNIRTSLLPELNGQLFVDATGKLANETIEYFVTLAGRPLEQMKNERDLSEFKVTIDPNQNVASTSKLVIAVQLVPVGVARAIEVNIGFTVKLT